MKKILFLCTGNSCRSQMAEGFARSQLGNEYEVYSAGTKKHGMNDRAMKVMLEAGIDISSHYSKTVEELPAKDFDFIVTVCDSAKEACPYFPGGRIIHMGFQDPPELTRHIHDEEEILAIYRRIRDEIKNTLLTLPERLGDSR